MKGANEINKQSIGSGEVKGRGQVLVSKISLAQHELKHNLQSRDLFKNPSISIALGEIK